MSALLVPSLCLTSWSRFHLVCSQLDKQHVEGMEVYSTVLWHLKRDTDLSYLAQDLVAIDRMAPQVGGGGGGGSASLGKGWAYARAGTRV